MFCKKKYRPTNRAVWLFCIALYISSASFIFAQNISPSPPLFDFASDNQADSLLKQGYDYLNAGKYVLAAEFYEKSLKLAEDTHNMRMQAFCWHQLGVLGKKQGDYTESLHAYEKALKIRELQKDEKGIANTLVAIADIYVIQGNPPKSYEYQLKALTIAEKIGDKSEMQVAFNGIGQYYHWQNDWNKALDYFSKAYKMSEEIGDKRWMAFSLNNMADVYRIEKNYSQALECLLKSLKIREDIRNKHEIGMSYNDLGLLYLKMGNTMLAQEYYAKAIRIFWETNSKPNLSLSLVNAGEVYLKSGILDSAHTSIRNGLDIAQDIGMKYTVRKAYLLLTQLYQEKKDFSKALENYQNYVALKDTLFNEEKRRQMTELNTRYETAKKEAYIEILNKDNQIKALALEEQLSLAERKKAELALLMKEKELEEARLSRQSNEIKRINEEKKVQNLLFQQAEETRTGQIRLLEKENSIKAKELENQQLRLRNWLLYGFLGILVAGTAIAFFIMQERQKLRLETEKRLRENVISQFNNLRNQVNPHFLFNSLANLSGLIVTNPEKAQSYTRQFAKVYRYVLELKDNLVVSLSEELEMSEAFITLQKLRFGENIQVLINVAPHIIQNKQLPPLSLQLLIENAIKHNEISEANPLRIQIYDKNDYLVVENNLQPRLEKEDSTKIGLQNLRERYKLASDKLLEFDMRDNKYFARIPLL
jgi:tetratricopeptide (TPR) repeat protein